MGRSLLVVVLVAACGGVVGCGGIDPADFDGAFLDARCDYYVRCGLFENTDACGRYYERTQLDDPSIVAAIDAGKTQYDEDAADACVAALTELSCDTAQYDGHQLDVCNDVFTGTGAMGAGCTFDAECSSDHCLVPDCAQACCTGACGSPRVVPAIGQPCSSVCVDGALCALDNTCHAAFPTGAACTDPLLCDLGLYCAGWSATTAGVCAALPQHGEACEANCAELGDVCNDTCVAAGLPGDACASGVDCSPYYQCDASLHCAPYPTLGMPCEGRCSDNSWCNAAKTCVAQQPNGTTCTRNEECTSHYCDGTCIDVPLCI